MAYRVALAGIDGSGKSTAASFLVDRLAGDYKVLKSGRPIYTQEGDDRTYHFERANGMIDRMHSHFDRSGSRPGIVLVNGAGFVLRLNAERRMMNRFSPDIVIADRDATLCTSTYITYYAPASRHLSAQARVQVFSALGANRHPDRLFYLDIDPAVAAARINGRVDEGYLYADRHRDKFRHMHETEEDLAGLRAHYLRGVEVLSNKGVSVTMVEVTHMTQTEVVDFVEGELRSELGRAMRQPEP